MPAMNGKIIIAGAGTGGLTAALALLRRGIDVAIYEQQTSWANWVPGFRSAPTELELLRTSVFWTNSRVCVGGDRFTAEKRKKIEAAFANRVPRPCRLDCDFEP
jgi:2-polyprenyl-6-methoxyphenol hydroxylase-like FAD-dependent oxidoreductase